MQSIAQHTQKNRLIKEKKNYDKNPIHLPRQEVVFSEECRKIKSYGSLREDFYTKFKPKNKGFGAVTWLELVIKIYMLNEVEND